LIALSKMDAVPADVIQRLRPKFEETGHPIYPISAVTGEGLELLVRAMKDTLEATKPPESIPVLMPALKRPDQFWDVVEVGDGYQITGARMERMVAMTDLSNDDAIRYLHRRLERIGVIDRLRKIGAAEGDLVKVGQVEFAFSDEV
jgi:GTP-binding protein